MPLSSKFALLRCHAAMIPVEAHRAAALRLVGEIEREVERRLRPVSTRLAQAELDREAADLQRIAESLGHGREAPHGRN